MSKDETISTLLSRIVDAEEALAEYAHLYGLTQRARTIFSARRAEAENSRLDPTNGERQRPPASPNELFRSMQSKRKSVW